MDILLIVSLNQLFIQQQSISLVEECIVKRNSSQIVQLKKQQAQQNSVILDAIEKKTMPVYSQSLEKESESCFQSNNLKPEPIFRAQLENFNPELLEQETPDVTIEYVEPETKVEETEVEETPEADIERTESKENEEDNEENNQIIFIPESLVINYDLNKDNFGQRNQFIEGRTSFRIPNDDLIHFRTGFNTFSQEDVETINNVPIEFGWSRKIDPIKLEINGSLDYFNRLSLAPGIQTKIEYPVFARVNDAGKLKSLLVVSGEIDHKPYKFNAKTLENGIRYWRIIPSVFWQFTPNTSLFTLGQVGAFNDGNEEFQSFSRLEHKFNQLEDKIGTFSIAANLFTWAFRQDLEATSGYFSPPDFLVYSFEIGWSAEIADIATCRVSASQGRQRAVGTFANAGAFQSRCTFKLPSGIELDLGYGISNVINSSGETAFVNESISGNLLVNF